MQLTSMPPGPVEGVGGNNERSFVAQTLRPHGADGATIPFGSPIVATFKEDGGFAGDVTGRLGYTWGNWMLYAKGGFAWFDPNKSASAIVLGTGANVGKPIGIITGFHDNNSLTGWTLGGGVEWLLNPKWSVKIEYLHYDFGTNDSFSNTLFCTTAGACAAFGTWRTFDKDLTVDRVKLGINYHLTSGYVPLK